MLSISNLKSSGDATKYYSADDYYLPTDNPTNVAKHQKNSSWYGKGAKLLGLEGEVNKDNLKDILDGNLLNGESLGRKREGKLA